MRRGRGRAAALVAATLLFAAGDVDAADDAATLSWLAGDWVHEADGLMTEESWLPPLGGMMLGVSRESKEGQVRMFEFARIAAGLDGRLSFVAQPKGDAPTSFQAVEAGASSILFENRQHDYPQRIRYWREGDRLLAEISMADGSRARRWAYRRR
jgi:hypothetical protein